VLLARRAEALFKRFKRWRSLDPMLVVWLGTCYRATAGRLWTISLKSPHRAQEQLLRPLKQHLAGQLLPTDAKVKQMSPTGKGT
jgi:hypothetical protein